MQLKFTVVDIDGMEHDVVLYAEGTTPLSIVTDRLAAAIAEWKRASDSPRRPSFDPPTHTSEGLYLDETPLPEELTVAESPLHDGCRVGLHRPISAEIRETSVVELRVVSGPGAGNVYQLNGGETLIGRDPTCNVRLRAPTVPRHAARLQISTNGSVTVTPVASAAQVELEGEPLVQTLTWNEGQQLTVGDVLVELHHPTPPDVKLRPSSDATGLDYNRPPRLRRRRDPVARFRLPEPLSRGKPRTIPILASIAPLALGVTLAIAYQRAIYLLIAILAPLMAIADVVSDHWSGTVSYRRRSRVYKSQQNECMTAVERALTDERSARRDAHPDPAEVLTTAVGPTHRLWERRPSDDDYLVLRVGTANLPADVVLDDPTSDSNGPPVTLIARDVPVTITFPGHGVIGVAGASETVGGLARWLVAQAAVLHSPTDLSLCILSDADAESCWEWSRWLPHLRPQDGDQAVALVGTDAETIARRVTELASLVAARVEDRQMTEGARPAVTFLPNVLLVTDGAPSLRELRGFAQILRDGPTVGVYSLFLERSIELLPHECDTVIAEQNGGAWRVQTKSDVVDVRHLDLLDVSLSERIARALAPVRDPAGGPNAGLPDTVRLLDLLGVNQLTPASVAAGWEASSPRGTVSLVGVSLDGPFAIDLNQDGPDGLIAGMTGSGKTELFLTIIASLAATNRPDELVFLLLDYKGGSAFRDCISLPHVVGFMTDLDRHGVARVLESLFAELRRRQRVLADASAANFEDYTAERMDRSEPGSLPRLVVIIDEFAAMAAQDRDFAIGLDRIIGLGRSLGVHLLLGTQRPAGVVSERMQSTIDLRIAFRVRDRADSFDVIGAADAVRIPRSRPGRGYARLGPGVLVPFQAARIGGYPPAAPTVPLDVRVQPLEWKTLGRPVLRPPSAMPVENQATDLRRLVDAVNGASQALGIGRLESPVLPPLPALLLFDSSVSNPAENPSLRPLVFGLEDRPDRQSQTPAVLDLATLNHLVVAGAPRSGRSQFLRTLALAVACQYSCADVHLYGIHSAGRALSTLTELPHCGAVVSDKDPELIATLLRRLTALVRRRQELMAEGGFRHVTQQRQATIPPLRLPHIILLVDDWERVSVTLAEVDHGRLMDDLLGLLHEGGSAGVHVIIAGDSQLLTKHFAARAEKLVLRLTDAADFGSAGVDPRRVPDTMPPGRAIRGDSSTELQVALIDNAQAGQTSAFHRLAASARTRDSAIAVSQRPFTLDDDHLVDDRFHVGDPQGRPIGREDVIAWLRDRHATGTSALLVGPRRAGKTWILRELARRLVRDGSTSVNEVLVPQPSTAVDTPDALAGILYRDVRGASSPSEALFDAARARSGTSDRLVFLLDEVGRLIDYHPAAVSWLRDLGQNGAWLVYTGSEKDWHSVRNWALTAPGSSFGNDVNARILGPLDERAAIGFIVGTAANLGVTLEPATTTAIISRVGTWPFYLQVVGDAVVRSVQSGDTKPLIDAGALSELVESHLLDEWTQHFQARWAEIGAAGRAALLSHPGAAPDALAPAQRNDLREVGLLCAGDVWLPDGPFFEWVARNSTSLQDRVMFP